MLFNNKFDENGTKIIAETGGVNSDMIMDVSVRKLSAGDTLQISEPEKECAVLLTKGELIFEWQQNRQEAFRRDVFSQKPYCLHVPNSCEIKLSAVSDCEVIIQATHNSNSFSAKLYSPEDCTIEQMGKTQWDGTADRKVLTVFDYNNAPYSNMVMGEVINQPGRWSSYVPHSHPQPEIYYYKFSKEQGFGASFIGNEAYKISDGSASCISGGLVHPQVTAPGYAMYYCWMIRHLDNNPWTSRENDPAHTWLLEE